MAGSLTCPSTTGYFAGVLPVTNPGQPPASAMKSPAHLVDG